MSNKNKLIGLSLIALATLCACTDDNHADGKGNRLVTFSVNTKANGGWSDINGSRSAWMSPQAQQMGEPVEMEGKLNGKTVYLTSEVTEGFPTDNPTFTRGTQITNADGMSSSFGVTAFLGKQKYMDHVEIKKSADSWKPETDYFWLNGKPLDFYAWYPYNSAEGTNGIPAGMTLKQEDFSFISYTVPTDVSKQEDLMFAVNKNASEPADGKATSLDFKHSLAAVKFVVGDLPAGVTVKSIIQKGVKVTGSLNVNAINQNWVLEGDAKDMQLVSDATAGTDDKLPAEGEAFFMMPQDLDSKVSVEVVLNDGTVTGSLLTAPLTGTWVMGNTYTYNISRTSVTPITSNSEFIAYTQEALTDQVAFFVNAGSSTGEAKPLTISADNNVTVSPSQLTKQKYENEEIKVTWPANVATATVTVNYDSKNYKVKLERKTPDTDGAYWIYSIPETTSASLGSDIASVQNASKSDWIAMTSSAKYSSNYSTTTYENSQGGDIYLQTLSVPSGTTSRFASLLVKKENINDNVMCCVEQLHISTNFGFKDCERNISRESEQWNIVVSGGRFKDANTALKARVVISSDVPDNQITKLGRDLTYNSKFAEITYDKNKRQGVSINPYVKKRWDTAIFALGPKQKNPNANEPVNNGTRSVNVQIQIPNVTDKWFDCGEKGTMSDRFHWGKDFAIGHQWTDSQGNGWDNAALPILRDYWFVHKKHPMFGLHRWGLIRWDSNQHIGESALFLVCSTVKGWAGLSITDIYGITTDRSWDYIACANIYSITDPENPDYDYVRKGDPSYSNAFIKCKAVRATRFPDSDWTNYPGPNSVWIPVVYTTAEMFKGTDYYNAKSRPSDTMPIKGKSVNE